jgi:hypothetical protein
VLKTPGRARGKNRIAYVEDYMKKAKCFTVGFAFALISFLITQVAQPTFPAAVASAAGQQGGAQQLGLVLGGKVFVRHGHYFFYNTDTHSTFRIVNPAKARAFRGDRVRIQGTVNAQRHTIYIYKIS